MFDTQENDHIKKSGFAKRPLIYFDNAASTPVATEVMKTVTDCMRSTYGNPSSVHEAGRRARVVVEQARRSVAALLKASPSEIFFTSGGTEANNAILWGCCRDLGFKQIVSSPLEHPAVVQTIGALSRQMGVKQHIADIDSKGHVNLDHLAFLLENNKGTVVSLMHANNETGNLLPIREVSELCRQHQALFHSDTVQTIGKFAVDLGRQLMDFAAGSAHKFYGPKGVGFMYVRGGLRLGSLIRGGKQERNLRGGTENVCGIAGMARALELAYERMEEDSRHISHLRQACIGKLRELAPAVVFNGDVDGSSLQTILNLTLPSSLDAGMLMPRLDMEGLCVSAGSACASGSNQGSHVLAAMGVDPGKPSLRLSFGRQNTLAEVEYLVEVLRELCSE